jgi:hypothetical protein
MDDITPTDPNVTNPSCLNDETYTDPRHDKHRLSRDALVTQEIPPKLSPTAATHLTGQRSALHAVPTHYPYTQWSAPSSIRECSF